jgi:hypothetical protein
MARLLSFLYETDLVIIFDLMINLLRSICTICFCSILLLSCKKNNDETPVYSCDQITKVIFDNFIDPLATIVYDGEGRVKYIKNDGKSSLAYTYFNDRIELHAIDYNGDENGLTYYLDANGRIKGTSLFDNQYTYNDEGYLVSFRQPYGTSTHIIGYDVYTLKYEKGDLVELFSPTNVTVKKVNFKYYDDLNQDLLGFNQPLYMMLGNRSSFHLIGSGFFGKQSTHLYKTYALNDIWSDYQIPYTRDGKGRITSQSDYDFEYYCP